MWQVRSNIYFFSVEDLVRFRGIVGFVPHQRKGQGGKLKLFGSTGSPRKNGWICAIFENG